MSELFPHLTAFSVFLAITAVGFLFLLVSLVFGGVFEHIGGDHFDHGGPGFLSARVLSVFITAFGGLGAVAVFYGLSTLSASGVGFAGGVFFASIIYGFARFLYGQQTSSSVRTNDILGQSAQVTVAIPAGGLGQVRCRLGEEMIDKIAQSQNGEPIPAHTVVRVEEVLGETVVVRRQQNN